MNGMTIYNQSFVFIIFNYSSRKGSMCRIISKQFRTFISVYIAVVSGYNSLETKLFTLTGLRNQFTHKQTANAPESIQYNIPGNNFSFFLADKICHLIANEFFSTFIFALLSNPFCTQSANINS